MKQSLLHKSIVLVLLAAACAWCLPALAGDLAPVARRGILDLRRWDPAIHGPVRLDGQWRFSWARFDDPRSVSSNDPAAGLIGVPGSWNGAAPAGMPLPGQGFGTYRLRVLLNPQSPRLLALKTGIIQTASRLYVNGLPVSAGGRPGTTMAESEPGNRLGVAVFERRGDELDLVVHVANFHHRLGGLYSSLTLGTPGDLMTMRERAVAYEMFLFGSILIIALYHVSLFLLRRSDRSSLWFGLYCFAIALFDITMGDVHWGTGGLVGSWEFRIKLVNLSFYASAPFFTRFCHALFPEDIPRPLVSVMDAASLVFGAIALVTPARVFSQTEQPYQVITLVVALAVIALIVRAWRRGREGALFILGGLLVLFLAALNDILHDNEIVSTGYFVPLGLLVVILVQAFWLSRRSARAFEAVAHLSQELRELNANLAEKIEDRTRELQAAMAEMEAINDRLVETNSSLEDARRIADDDMAMAFNVQASVLPREVPSVEGWDLAHLFLPMAGVSGDFYDYYLDENQLKGVGIFDVSGHGISSGLVTMIAKTVLFRIFRRMSGQDLGSVMAVFNRELHREIGKAQYYLSGALLRFEGSRVQYVNAGHPDIIVKRGDRAWPAMGDRGEALTGFLLGVRETDYTYDIVTLDLQPGDYLVLCTDGLTEARNVRNDLYTFERVVDTVARARPGSANEVLEEISAAFTEFVDGRDRLTDDLTILIMRRQ